jgi:hypothetical protein
VNNVEMNLELYLNGCTQNSVVGFCKHGNEPTGSIRDGGVCLQVKRLLDA